MRNGSERVVTSAREHVYDMKALESYSYTDELGKDQGINGNTIQMHMKYFTYLYVRRCIKVATLPVKIKSV